MVIFRAVGEGKNFKNSYKKTNGTVFRLAKTLRIQMTCIKILRCQVEFYIGNF